MPDSRFLSVPSLDCFLSTYHVDPGGEFLKCLPAFAKIYTVDSIYAAVFIKAAYIVNA